MICRCQATSDTWWSRRWRNFSRRFREARTRSSRGRSQSTRWSPGWTTPFLNISRARISSSNWNKRRNAGVRDSWSANERIDKDRRECKREGKQISEINHVVLVIGKNDIVQEGSCLALGWPASNRAPGTPLVTYRMRNKNEREARAKRQITLRIRRNA